MNKKQNPPATPSKLEFPVVTEVDIFKAKRRLVNQFDLPEARRLTLASVVAYDSELGNVRKGMPPGRMLAIGHAIQNPIDENNPALGIKIAESRAVHAPYFQFFIHSRYISDDMIQKVMRVVADEFKHNFQNYVQLGSGRSRNPARTVPTIPAEGIVNDLHIGEPATDFPKGSVEPESIKRPYTKTSGYWGKDGKRKSGRKRSKVQQRKKKVGAR